jgi:hypothetical protein
MLTDVALKALKPREKPYKVTDRDGMYVHVQPTGGLSFRLDYRRHGRRETVPIRRRPQLATDQRNRSGFCL